MSVAILGAGAFGTALACALSSGGCDVVLIGRNLAEVMRTRQTPRLPGVTLPQTLKMTEDPAALSDAKIVLLAVTSQAIRSILDDNAARLAGKPLVACCKGIDLVTLDGPTSIISKTVPSARPAVLTGPSFAADIARGLPTALTLACPDEAAGSELQEALSTPVLRLYRTTDTTGAELGGALKNVIAIGCGVAMGAGLGESARAALLTRGFAEMRRFAVALGAQAQTLDGLSGFGDLALTCTSEQSRNYRFGLALGRGKVADKMTVEGVNAATAACRIADTRGVTLPVARTVEGLVSGALTVEAAVASLMERPLRPE